MRILRVSAACALVGFACGTPPAYAQVQDLQAVVTGMRACAAEQDDARRLSCYDKQFRQGALTSSRADPATAPDAASSRSSTAPSAGPPAISAAPASLTPEQRFGLNAQLERKEHGTATQPPQLDKLRSRIAAVSYKLRGEAVVTLDNGQVWEQSDTDSRVPLQPGDAISIRRGSLGSFWLSAPKAGFRARRVR
jgi:hypothetical protein